MSQEPDRLLESDRLEDVLEEEGPPQPVLVVQYRTRTVPWLLIVVLAITLGLGSLFIYQRREVERLRALTLEARRELQRLAAMSRAEEPRTSDPPAKAAVDPRPSDAADAQPIAISTVAGSPASTQAPAPPDAPIAPGPAQTPEPAKADPAMARTQLPLKTDPAPVPDPTAPVTTAAQVTDPTSPFEELSGNDGGSRAGVPTGVTTPALSPTTVATGPAPDPAPAVAAPAAAAVTSAPAPASARPEEGANPAGPVAVATEPPLPSREENERQLLEEAATKQAEDDRRLAQQQQDLKALKDEDRTKFRDELRMLLRVHGKRAGKEIEELSTRAGRDDDPDLKARAYRVLGTSGSRQKDKVRQLRAIGMPEPVILDYIANQFDKTLGTRNGPRSRDEVWVMAARRLLTYELTPAPQRPADGRRHPDDPGRQSAKPPAAGPMPARGTPRTP